MLTGMSVAFRCVSVLLVDRRVAVMVSVSVGMSIRKVAVTVKHCLAVDGPVTVKAPKNRSLRHDTSVRYLYNATEDNFT